MKGHSKETAKVANPLLGGMFFLLGKRQIYIPREKVDWSWSGLGKQESSGNSGDGKRCGTVRVARVEESEDLR